MAIHIPESGSDFNAEPNVVPMIDILLVLLIIFMMQIPLSRKAMDVQVPPEIRSQQQQSATPSNNIVLDLKGDGTYEINGQTVEFAALDREFHRIYDNRPAKIMFVRSAGNRRYEEVIGAIDIARGAGVQVIGFTPPQEEEGSGD
jgi:biopolymer transport protein ExbD